MSVSIQLHPLAVLNISDHLTRAKYLSPDNKNLAAIRVVGALLGKQEGRTLEIVNTVEITFQKDTTNIDAAFMGRRLDSYKKNFPELDCIGWYSADFNQHDEPLQADSQIQRAVQQFSENPLYLIMNPSSQEAKDKKTLPFFLYEHEQQRQRFIRLDYNLATSDSERISVDHVAKATDPNAKTSVLSQNMLATINAVKILRRKIAFLIDIVANSPEVRQNHEFMRKLN